MYNIALAASPEFNFNPASRLPQEAWSFNPRSPYQVISFINGMVPANTDVATHIQNYFLTHQGLYTNIYVKLVKTDPIINGNPAAVLVVTGPIATATGLGYEINANNLDVINGLVFTTNNIPSGTWRTVLSFQVVGRRADNSLDQIDIVEYVVDVFRLTDAQFALLPSAVLQYSYLMGSGIFQTRQKTIYVRGTFQAVAGKHIGLSGSSLTLQSEIDGVRTYNGNGEQLITFSLLASIDTETGASYGTDVVFSKGSNSVAVSINVLLFGNESHIVTPEFLDFVAIKAVSEADWQEFNVTGIGNYTIAFPNWLQLEGSASGNGSNVHKIKPIHSDNLNIGTYTGQIKVTSGSTVHVIEVRHQVFSRMRPGYSTTGLNFTRDMAGISALFGRMEQNVLIENTISYSGFMGQTFEPRSFTFTKAFFSNQTDFWLGNIVDKIMKNIESPADVGLSFLSVPPSAGNIAFRVFKAYAPARVYARYSLYNRATGDQESEHIVHQNVMFLRGRKPSRLSSKAGIIDVFESALRVTQRSFALLPVWWKEGSPIVQVLRNGSNFATIYPNNEGVPFFQVQFSFSQFTPGDVIDVVLKPSGPLPSTGLSQRYIVFPQGQQSFHIAWETEHRNLQLLEFTGEYEFRSEHKGITSIRFENFLESLEKYASKRTLKFVANTGWILKSNQERIDSLTDANRAWIIFTDNRPPISLVPDDAKITNIDSDAGTYQYTVEFTINPKHELENNTF